LSLLAPFSWSFCALAQPQISRYAPRGFTVPEKTHDAAPKGKTRLQAINLVASFG
jgi:hypothetical protein